MRTSSHQNVVDSFDAVLWRAHLGQVDGLHDTRRSQQERAVCHSTSSGNDLTGASKDRLISEFTSKELELAVLHLLFAKWAFSGSPLETVNDRSLKHVELLFVNFSFDCVVDKHVGAWQGGLRWAERPD